MRDGPDQRTTPQQIDADARRATDTRTRCDTQRFDTPRRPK